MGGSVSLSCFMFLMVSPTLDVAIGEAHETLVRGVFDPPVRVAGALAANLDPCNFSNTWSPRTHAA